MQEINLGQTIKNLRSNKGLSIRKTAAMAGITASMLSQIESEQVNPSINTLKAIAHVLETPLYTFFVLENADESVVITPESRIALGSNDGTDIRYELLTPDTKGDIEFCIMIIPPNASTSAGSHILDDSRHQGEEVAYMVSGLSVELEMDGCKYQLKQGDSVRIPPNTVHCWKNHSRNEVQVIFAITPPTF